MADPRQFTLIGEFRDGITPELEKINRQLAALKSNFAGVGSKKNTGFRGATQEIGKLVSAHKNLANSIKTVGNELRSATGVLQQYRREMGKAAAATRAFQKSGGNMGSAAFAKNMRAANTEAQRYLRTLQQINSQKPRAMRAPSGGGGGGRQSGGRGGRGGGGGGAGPGGFHMAEFGFAYTLGSGISQPIQNAIAKGFQIGVGFMTKPFEYFANRLGERMRDELSDLKAAGGFFSMAKRQKDPFVKSFAESIQFTQENNKVMARLAASLPGKTQDYIEVAKRVSDSVARTVLNDRAATMKMAEKIRAGDIRTYGAKSITEMTGTEATKKTIQVLLGDLTKDTVLAGMGGRSGAGGAMGAYGLPQLSERMISQDEVSMGQMQRYSAIFSDPMIMDALQRNISKINATSKNSADRLQAIADMYKEIVTPELVERYRRTLAGVAETFNTAIFGEETGLFGLGRKMEGLGVKFNEYGQMLDKTGEVTTDLTQAAREDLAIYDLFRDILVNVGQVIAPIVENLSMIYDPLKQLGFELNKAREITYKVLQSFNQYRKGFEDYGKRFKGLEKEKFDATRDLRAALLTIGNVMAEFKVIGEGDFANLLTQLKDPNAQMGPILQKMVDQFLTSDVAGKIGEFIGTIVGTVLTEVAKVTGFISGRLKQSNKLFEGMKKGFEDAGGPAAFRAIFRDVFMSIGKLLWEIAKVIPLEVYMLAAAMVVLPAAAQGLGMALAQAITGAMGKLGKKLTPMMSDSIAGAGGQGGRRGGSFMQTRAMRRQQLLMQRAARRRAAPYIQGAQTLGAFGQDAFMSTRVGKGFATAGRGIGAVSKVVPGAAVAGGVLSGANSLMQGEGIGRAIAQTFGTVIGATAGSVFGPVGTVLGGMAGDAITRKLFSVFDPQALRQEEAAKLQMEAAARQLEAAKIGEAKPTETPYAFTSQKLEQVLALAGVPAEQSRVLVEQTRQRNVDLQAFTQASKTLADMRTQLATTVKPGTPQFEAAIKPYQAAVDLAARKLSSSQTTLQKNMEKIPPAMLTSVVTKISTMSMGQVEAAFANKVSQMQLKTTIDARNVQIMQAGGRPGITPVSQAEMDKRAASTNSYGRYFSGNNSWRGSLSQAVSSEMKNKPSNSDLVIANSSETVIPAAGGYGMIEFVDTLKSGFTTMISTFRQAQQKQDSMLTSINQTLKSNQQQTNTRLFAMEKKFSTPGMTGGLGGAAAGGVDAFTGMAQKYGLQMTSGYRPGDPGWHGANRARDFSNGTGPTPQMMQFAQFLASNYGSNLKELIYTPLGFSIKNGQKVAPYAQGSHYNHVHVAYAMGLGQGVAFNSLSGAQDWERSMVPGSVKVGSVTSNSSEGFGGSPITINAPITINQQPGQDADALASIVAMKIGEAVAQARSSSVFV